MAYGDPVLQRSMFRGPSVQPSVGLGSGTSADENAQALRNMFSPTVSINEPVAMIQQEQQPVQSFRGGGEVINGVKHFQEGGLNLVDQSGVFPGTEMIPQEPTEGLTGIRGLLQRGAVGLRSLRPTPQTPTAAPAAPRVEPGPRISAEELSRMSDADRAAESGAFMGRPAPAPSLATAAAPPAERPKGALELTLEGIRAERARSADDKRQNALLALMQAGLAMAGGRSPNAISNIAAGGQAGIAAFAGMEKDRRAEQSALRREETALLIERERMRAQEERAPEAIRTYAMLGGWNPAAGTEGFNDAVRRGIEVTKSLEKEPDNIRLFKALGNGNLARGFEVYNSDNALKAANTTVNNLQASDEDRRTAQNYINIRIRQAQQAVSGSGQAPPAGSTVIPFNQLPVR